MKAPSPTILVRLATTIAYLLLAGSASAQDHTPSLDPPATPAPTEEVAQQNDNAVDFPDIGEHTGRDIVVTGSNVHIKPGEVVHDVSVTSGDVLVEGEVTGDLVVIGGKATIHGKVAGDAVNVGRGLRIENGGFIGGDAVGVGFGVQKEPDGIIQGQVANVGLALLPETVRNQAILFFDECVLLGRPLSLKVAFVWPIWGLSLLLQALLGLLFPAASKATLDAMRERPGGTALLGIFGLPLLLLASTFLTFTVIAALAVPFLIAATLIGLCIGRLAILRLLGSRILRVLGVAEPVPAAEFAIGAAIVTSLLLIPFMGILVWMVLVLWALGGVLMALFRRDRVALLTDPTGAAAAPHESPQFHPVESGAAGTATASATQFVSARTGIPSPTTTIGADTLGTPSQGNVIPPKPSLAGLVIDSPPPGIPFDAASAPRPTFGRRLGALAIDWVPLLTLAGIMPDRFLFVDPENLVGLVRVGLGVAYFTVMLTWRGTTLGGMVLGLRVVRLDGRPLDRTVALVRSLAAILSGLSLGLGWFWASWDTRRQTWHDRLAGTATVRDDSLPPLV